MTTPAQLEALTRSAGDVCCLVNVAADLVAAVESGDIGRAHVLGAVIRSLHHQACALHKMADAEWMAAHALAQKVAA